MKTVFLAFSFRPEDRALVSYVEQLLESHDIRAVTGRRLGGEKLTPEIQSRIGESDGLIALLTRREQKVDGKWSTHPWVEKELEIARQSPKPAIAVIEGDVETDESYREHERLDYDSNNPTPALVALSQTIGLWKREAGQVLKVRILPQAFAKKLANQAIVEYRLFRHDRPLGWINGFPIQEPGGVFLYVKGIRSDTTIQFKAQVKEGTWTTGLPAPLESMSVKFRKE